MFLIILSKEVNWFNLNVKTSRNYVIFFYDRKLKVEIYPYNNA